MTPTICYLGAFEAEHSRNSVIRAGLAARGWQVTLAPLPVGLDLRRSAAQLWRIMRREARACDALIVAEYNPLLAPLAVGLGRLLGKPVLLDYSVGLYEARVVDNNAARRRDWRPGAYRALDAWNLATANGAFTDTSRHKAALVEQIGAPARKLAVVPIGVSAAWLEGTPAAPERAPNAPLLLQFYGHYTPFHGTEVILRALSWLNTDERFRFEMIGRGPKYQEAVERARLLGLQRLDFIEPPGTPELIRMAAQADICLGVFARRAKTDYVVPHRIMECLALGKPVVTAESAAVAEYFTPGEDLLTVPPSDPGALARAIRRLADEPELRARLGRTGAATVRRQYTPEQTVAPLIALLERIL